MWIPYIWIQKLKRKRPERFESDQGMHGEGWRQWEREKKSKIIVTEIWKM